MAETRNYPILVAGVSNYQPAIARCREWDRVWLFHESDNPHDQLAIVVKTERGETIGYLPKNNWISDAVHREGVGATALILALKKWSGATGVVLRGKIVEGPIGKAPYSERKPGTPAAAPSQPRPKVPVQSAPARRQNASYLLGRQIGRLLRLFRR